MKKFIKRLIKEHSKLVDKIDKLKIFVHDAENGYIEEENEPSFEELNLLKAQLSTMLTYEVILNARLFNHGILVRMEYKDIDTFNQTVKIESDGDS